MERRTFSRVFWATTGTSRRTKETVARDTEASLAISLKVTRALVSRGAWFPAAWAVAIQVGMPGREGVTSPECPTVECIMGGADRENFLT
jgi:hypothetical protein